MTLNQPPATNNPAIANVMRPLHDAAGWMKLIGTLGIIYGILIALTIIGLVVAWLPIWMGVLLRRAADESRAAAAAGDEARAIEATRSLGTIFKVQGVIVLIGLIFWAVGLVVLLVALVAGDADTLAAVRW
jgi:hypothetical protein